MTVAPTLAEIGMGSDVQKILEANAQEVIKEPTERWATSSSTVRYGDKKLPERVTVYRRLTGRAVELPTATISQSLAKKAPDGGPAFVRTQAEAATIPTFIDKVCEVCREVSGKPKQFYKESNYRGHMRGFHELEWEEIQRQEDRDERRQDRELMAAALRQATSAASTSIQEVSSDFKCDECGKAAASKAGLLAHQRSHVSSVPV